jgi:hypothetical protein
MSGGLGGTLLIVFLFLVGAIVRAVVGQEAKGRCHDLSSYFVQRAADRLPPAHRDEKRAEWNAELFELREKPLSALRFSWRIYRLRTITAHELRAIPAAPAVPLEEPVSPPLSLDELHPRLRASIESLREFDWRNVIEAMHDPTLWHVDESLNIATARFVSVIEDSRLPPGGIETARLIVRLSDAVNPRVRRHYAPAPDWPSSGRRVRKQPPQSK